MNTRLIRKPIFFLLFILLVPAVTTLTGTAAAPLPAALQPPDMVEPLEPLKPFTLGVDPDCTAPEAVSAVHALREAGVVGRTIMHKNAELLIHAAPTAVPELQQLTCIVYVTPSWQYLERLAAGDPSEALQRTRIEPQAVEDAVRRLRADASGPVLISSDEEEQTARFIRLPGGFRVDGAAGQDAAAAAGAFLTRYGAAFGVQDASSELQLVDERVDQFANSHLTYQQVYADLPVFGGELRVHLDSSGRVTSANGTFLAGISLWSADPALTPQEAADIAVTAVAGRLHHERQELSAGPAQLLVYRAGLVQDEPGSDYLAYELQVSSAQQDVREFIYVDAHRGSVLDQFSGILSDLQRKVSLHAPENVVWREGDPDPIPEEWAGAKLWQVIDWQEEIDGAREVYNFFGNLSGGTLLSFDGAGAELHSSNVNVWYECPNAYWNGQWVTFCPGTTGDDTVAHEWAHAYEEKLNGLVYAYQSGALNESYSDVWGEAVDLLNGRGLDGPNLTRAANTCSSNKHGANLPGKPQKNTVRWLAGENDSAFFDLPEGSGNAIRDMWDPTCFGNPGRVNDAEYACHGADNVGVHANSGVPNHAFALLVDGGAYNGQTITALGLTKAAHIYWAAQNMLTPTSQFRDHADALEAACTSLIGEDLPLLSTAVLGAGSSGEVISTGDCEQVAFANEAVELRSRVCYDPELGSVSGLVTAEEGGEPLQGVDVIVGDVDFSEYGIDFYWQGEDHTDYDGTYLVGRLQEWDYYNVMFSYYNTNYAYEFYDDTLSLLDAEVVSVREGQITSDINAELSLRGHIAGTVTTAADGSPLAGIEVYFWAYDRNAFDWVEVGQAKTDEKGAYAFKNLQPDIYWVEFYDPAERYNIAYFDNTRDWFAGEHVIIEPGKTVTGVNGALQEPGAISGKVTSAADGKPVQDLLIEVYTYVSFYEQWVATDYPLTESDGSYRTRSLPAGSYRVQFGELFYGGADEIEGATDVYIVDGQTTSGVDAVLLSTGQVSGTVTAAENGAALKDIEVRAIRYLPLSDTWDERIYWIATADKDGKYLIPDLPAGSWKIEFTDYSAVYGSEFYDGATFSDAADVLIEPGQTTTDIDAALDRAGTIRGRVTDTAGGAPLEEILVGAYAYRDDGQMRIARSAWTDEDGRYELGGLASGAYRVHFSDRYYRDYSAEYYDDAVTAEGAEDILVTAGRSTTNIDAALTRGSRIFGWISGEGVYPMPYRTAYLYDSQGEIVDSDQADFEGEFVFRAVRPGSYRVQFVDKSLTHIGEFYDGAPDLESADAVQVEAGKDLYGVSGHLTPAGHIMGTVTAESDGAPLAGIEVAVLAYDDGSGSWDEVRSELTNSDGSYQFRGLVPGAYHLQFVDPTAVYADEYYDNAANLSGAAAIDVVPSRTLRHIDAALAEKEIVSEYTIFQPYMSHGD